MNGSFWLGCGKSQTITFNGGSTLLVNGAIYAPCADMTVNNNAQINAPLNLSLNVVANTIHVTGSAGIRTSNGTSGSAANAVLTQ